MPSNPGQNSLHKPQAQMSPKPHTKCNPNPRTCPLNPTLKCHQTPQKSNSTSQRKIHTHITPHHSPQSKKHTTSPTCGHQVFLPQAQKFCKVLPSPRGGLTFSQNSKSRETVGQNARISLVCRTNQRKKRFHMFKITPMGMEHSKRVRF